MTARQRGGFARARALSPRRRSEIARNASKARWAKRLYRFCRGPCERELPLDLSVPKICRDCLRLEWREEARRRYRRNKRGPDVTYTRETLDGAGESTPAPGHRRPGGTANG